MRYPKSLKGKVALIVGGNGAIGAATGKMLADAGVTVLISHMPGDENLESAGKVLTALGGNKDHGSFAADITDTPTLVSVRDQIEEKFGKLDILINAAGYTKPIAHHDLDALTDDLIDDLFKVNWRGQFATIRTFAPLLKASGDGLVVSLSSIAAFTGVGSNIAYCAAKAGIDVMTKALARVLAPEVRVLAISPGVVDTSFVPGRGADFNDRVASSTPLRRIGEVDDIAGAIVACATHLGFSTGHIIQVDGGRAL
ncbi:SDR family NAD(P)-dependent oxidoreductase [Rhizobium lentis]|uniref:SDR family oxidoreductase n=1 Tax=Rhizobium lentis TaxID=1138194 RepID=A0ABS7IAE0_9HYPH|nr:SDR family oxidoreductase [Rhizobium lentis]MBX5041199.1 SDR family oxidoreductase [Rhizobium lentis]MBX5051898.1 SDR family oxidoreductase [Rhizobium lentis]MBX5071456.1 SDR family oxidoreductase [Rhizobium lentis]MBX5088436.1 SDR family oxidoreductase [Rhizobium lentis]MBX5108506.1 SDR family oxidoreductase [Rhizobium lentis]